MSNGLKDLDQTHAIFGALSSFWWRLPILFGCFWCGHYVGLVAGEGGEFLQGFLRHESGPIFYSVNLNPFFAALNWFWVVLVGCETPLGMAYLLVVAVAFLWVRLSEDRFIHGFAIGLLIQPIHTFLAVGGNPFSEGFDPDPSEIFNLAFAFIVLLAWEVGMGRLYWRYWRQTE